MKGILRIRSILLILLFLAFLKLFFLGFLTVFHAYTLRAEEKKVVYKACPKSFSQILLIEKENIYQKGKSVEAKIKELKLMEKRIQEQLMALKELEATVESKLKEIQVIRTKKLDLLVSAIAKMQPSKAANMLINMDKDMAVKILSLLRSRQVASILSAMPPDKAAELSEALSGYKAKKF